MVQVLANSTAGITILSSSEKSASVDSYTLKAFRAAQRLALAAPPNGHSGSATAYKRKYVRNTAVGGVGYRRMLGRGMADDGCSARPTVGTAET